MTLVAVPNDPGLKVWIERVDPDHWIVLDHWDSEAHCYEYHDLDRPENHDEITAHVLEACFRTAGSTIVGDPSLRPDARYFR